MNRLRAGMINFALMLALVLSVANRRADASGPDTTIVYQGRLMQNGVPANGVFDVVLRMYAAEIGGQLIDDNFYTDIQITDGYLQVDFESSSGAFNYAPGNSWLEVEVDGVRLTPRQRLAPAPLAIQTRGLYSDANGSLVVGTTPAGSLASLTFSLGEAIYVVNKRWQLGISDTASNGITFYDFLAGVHRLAITPTGRVGINTPTPAMPLHVEGGAGMTLTTGGYAQFGPTTSANLAFDNNEIQARDNGTGVNMFINRLGGNVAIATGNPTHTLTVNGTASKIGGGSWSTYSDRRLKKNIEQVRGALEQLLAIRGVTFEYLDPTAINELPGTHVGVIAQEVEPFFPQWVTETKDGIKTVAFTGFEALAIEALRDLRQEKDAAIEALQQENDELRARLERVEAMLEKLSAELAKATP